MQKRLIIPVSIVILLLGAGAWWFIGHTNSTASEQPKSGTEKSAQTQTPTDSFDKAQYSTTDPASVWVIVNKQHPLQPISYAPTDLRFPAVTLRVPGQTEMQLRDAAATALEQLFAGANTAGYKLQVSTAYRGYSYQKTLYDGYVSSQGQASADEVSARPGYSEHQTGLAVDIRNQRNECGLAACFGSLPEGEWLAANAYRYGYLLRYPADKTAVTGYAYEPWHFRYIGTDLAQEMHDKNIQTLEEFFGVSGGTTYN